MDIETKDFFFSEIKRMASQPRIDCSNDFVSKLTNGKTIAFLERAAAIVEGQCTAVNNKKFSKFGDQAHEVAAMVAERDLDMGRQIRELVEELNK